MCIAQSDLVVQLVDYRSRNRKVAGSTHTRSNAFPAPLKLRPYGAIQIRLLLLYYHHREAPLMRYRFQYVDADLCKLVH